MSSLAPLCTEFTTSFNGSVGVTSFNTGTINWGSVPAGHYVCAAAFCTLSKNNTVVNITSISDNQGFTWTRAGHLTTTGINSSGLTGAPLAQALEIWYTYPASGTIPNNAMTITIHTDSDNVDSIRMYASLQQGPRDGTHPLDLNPSLPASAIYNNASTAGKADVTFSTTTSHMTVMAVVGSTGAGQRPNSGGNAAIGGPTSWDYGEADAFNLNANYNISSVWLKDYTSPLSGVTFSNLNATNNQMSLVVAFTNDAQVVVTGPVRSYGTMIG